jgi:hypothetical protein
MVIHAQERTKSKDRQKIDWNLIRNLFRSVAQRRIRKARWYAVRWKIATFHKILNSGCQAEASKLRAAERILNLIAVFCILSWRIFWMTMKALTASPTLALTTIEMHRCICSSTTRPPAGGAKLLFRPNLTKIVRLGRYRARAKDPPPSNAVMWSGVSRLTHIQLGFLMATHLVGN